MREDWVECSLGEILTVSSGKGLVSSKMSGKGFPVYGGNGITGYHEKFLFETPQLIIGRVGVRCGVTHITKAMSWVTDNALVVNFRDRFFDLKYFQLKLQFENLNKLSNSTAQPVISGSKLYSYNIDFPPLPIQRAIVAKIEELFSSLNSGIADLKMAQEQLKVYRQAILKKAFQGELTKEWRERQPDLPSTKELLEQIEQGRLTFYRKKLYDWKESIKIWKKNGEEGKKPIKPRPLTVPEPPNFEHNDRKWKIPNNWIWTQVGSVCFVTKLAGFEYTDYVKYDEKGDLPVIKAENAGKNGFKKTNFSKVNFESVKMLTRSQLFGGELLIVFVGNVGNVAMVPLNERYFLGPNIGMARPYFDLSSKYLELFLQSAFGKSLLMTAVKAVAQPSLSMGTIRQAPIAFPSIKEQHEIVKEIETRISVCDKVEADIQTSLDSSQSLRQSILKKAFEGKLLSEEEIEKCKQEKDYEPASVLLQKIKSEKNKYELK